MKNLFYFLVIVLIVSIVFLIGAFAHGDIVHEDTKILDISDCVNLDYDGRIKCYTNLCNPGYLCAELLVASAVNQAGPELGMVVLEDVMTSQAFSIKTDGHELAHIIGRETAKHFGLSGSSFLRCPSQFNYGCQHGFFERALLNTDSYAEAATSVCENLPENSPRKDRFYCYHGVGHGIMMSEYYNLSSALAACDSLPSQTAIEGCWQGLFMENVNSKMQRITEEDVFDDEDPLAPCNRIRDKYQLQCYINHAGYLMGFYHNSLKDSAEACLNASPNVIASCMQGLGLMVTNPGWQDVVAGNYDGDFIETAVYLCHQFPKNYVHDCNMAAVDNLLNFDNLNIERASSFCSLLEEKPDCYRRIGTNLDNIFTSQEQKLKSCDKVPKNFRDDCMGDVNIAQGISPDTTKLKQKIPILDSLMHGFSALADIMGFIINFNFGNIALDEQQDKQNEQVHDTKKIMMPEFDSPLIFSDDDFLAEVIRKYTLDSVTESLSRTGYSVNINCHNRAHELGRMAYKMLGAIAFKSCGIQCHSGCRHGATEAFFADKGTFNLQENINLLCDEELNAFNTHQCFHGIGHGLMAWSDYDLPLALSTCDLLWTNSSKSSCYSGVFMENIVGSIAIDEESDVTHFTYYLNDDPHYPCNIVEDKYKGQCYFLQTDRMLTLHNGNLSVIGIECAKAPQEYQHLCFSSMGRTVSGIKSRNPEASIQICREITNKQNSDSCIIGVLQDQFWDESQASGAIDFCLHLANTSLEQNCYNQITIRGADVLTSMQTFCEKFPEKYYEICINAKPSVVVKDDQDRELVLKTQAITNIPKTGNAVIVYENGTYTPNEIHVSVGQTVTWINNDQVFWPASNIHPTHTAYPNSGIKKCDTDEKENIFDACVSLSIGSEYSFAFNELGVWRFHDHVNPRANGVVFVS
ncbi:MAG: hypothetical protein AABX33_02350 [Nanoarchaeota archaeon]